MAASRRTCGYFKRLFHGSRSCQGNSRKEINALYMRMCSSDTGTSSTQASSKNNSLLFIDPRVQEILHKITHVNVDKVFRTRREPTEVPQYKLFTDEQLEQIKEETYQRSIPYLQPPPVLPIREPIDEVLSDDARLERHDKNDAKFVFTDITFGVHDRDRIIVVREPEGVLRKASWEERHHMNQIYHPQDGRMLWMPKLFQPEYLEAKLSAQSYVYILDKATIQFEPDDPEYIRVVERTYEHIDQTHQYDDLRSTRHFGNLAFYLVSHRRIDHLLVDMIQRDLLVDGADLIKLFTILYPDCKTATGIHKCSSDDSVSIIKCFIECDAMHGEVELALQSFQDDQDTQASS